MIFENPRITGVMVNYYFHCKRQLWLFANHIEMEHNSELVLLGKILSASFYRDKDKELQIDNVIAIDWFEFEDGIIHEVKKSDSFSEGHIWQVKYYIFYLKKKGVKAKGKINYPRLKKEIEVELKDGDDEIIIELLNDIAKIIKSETLPDRIEKVKCKGCSYFELCWS
ncbi:CRISPR-associated exonuclease Cas4 [Candidatus Kryptobacter tengchongensis]|nr:CRISPR-associated exonuclease, Cas4 family [Candidatus Kryptobacter tengchongensis]CUU09203.1 CRISPR-associated exonuclease Cas4 [Candidatus Kryptobacter tengchongensis]